MDRAERFLEEHRHGKGSLGQLFAEAMHDWLDVKEVEAVAQKRRLKQALAEDESGGEG